jgi:DNA-binding SARP family transcriptional activator
MAKLKVSLFGKFNISYGEKNTNIRARKVQELFIYLLMFRNYPQPRESLTEILWADQPAVISKKNLRQTLWHLQSAFKEFRSSTGLQLLIDDGWIHIRLPTDFWLDTAEFEQVFRLVSSKQARQLSVEDFEAMQSAVDLYRGDLLEGWYQDWCIFERERFQMMNLMLLDKLVQYCEIHREYDAGLSYGWQILRHDHAYERAHRQIMRLYYMSGDRTQALHQYERCVIALREELGVEPSARTKRLYEQIQLDTFIPPAFALERGTFRKEEVVPSVEDLLNRLEQFSLALRKMEGQVQEQIAALDKIVAYQTDRHPRKPS